MITSTSNIKVKNIFSLMKSAKARKKQDCFLVEGPRMFFEISPVRLKEVYVTEDFERKYADNLSEYHYELVSDSVFRHLSDTKTPQGVLAVVRRKAYTLEDILASDTKHPPCLMVLENLQDPGNMGTIFRTSEAAGVSGIIINQGSVDPYSPKVIRSTMGAVFRIPFLITNDLEQTLSDMKNRGINIYAAHLDGQIFYDENYDKGCAFMIGNEGNGLTDEAASHADSLIRIPMEGKIESLNAGIAASLLMYEVARQRKWS